MLKSMFNVFKVPDLKKKVLFTIGILVVYRLGSHIPAPGIDGAALGEFFSSQGNTLFGMLDLFVGGNLRKATIFALGIMPYITASIVMQLLGGVIPYFEKLKKQGAEGQKKITQYTRYGTVLIAAFNAFGITFFLESVTTSSGAPIVPHPGFMFKFVTIITFVTGTVFVMWLGEQINEKGIGNGISLIIFIGIVARYPGGFINMGNMIINGTMSIILTVFIIALMVFVTAGVILITEANRKIPVQYAKRVIGRKIYGGQSTHIPLKVNSAGVIPIIFAQSVLMFPKTITTFFPNSDFMQTVSTWLSPGAFLYTMLYVLMIIFFAYFYTAIVLNPVEIAENMKKYGGFIPGRKPGKKTAEYINSVITRITLPGAIFFAIIAVMPTFLIKYAKLPFYFGGTGLIIIVGVALDTLKQIESQLVMRHYDGFMKKGKLRGRR
ncbi:MAG: preprotein translocase subunit SecY [Candidatus Cloacimonetes bacterium]|nr:preprotein translocase subunit SecY [Candidatus Cloacimonadota bacterium]MBS3766933.1 preprotein translocase subunit SecY [Candidatus Cloacimonadota bacterium]